MIRMDTDKIEDVSGNNTQVNLILFPLSVWMVKKHVSK